MLIRLYKLTGKRLAVHQVLKRYRCFVDQVVRTYRGGVNRADVAERCTRLTPVSFIGLIRESAER